MNSKFLTLSVVSAAFLLANAAYAVSFGFEKITANAPEDISGQLAVEVLQTGSGFSFTFTNNVGIASNVSELYATEGYALGLMSISTTGGAVFTAGGSPANLPGMNSLGILADAQGNNGINSASRSVTLTFVSTLDFTTLIADLNSEALRLGVHVRGIGQNGDSDGYVTTGNGGDIPGVPDGGATIALLGAAFGALGLLRRRLVSA